MNKERYGLRLVMAIGICLTVLNLTGPLAKLLSRPEVASVILYLETGRVVKLQLTPPEPALPGETVGTAQETQPLLKPAFQAEDAELIEIRYHWDCALDTQAMLLSELRWDLTAQGPQVLILHSHATESYTPTPDRSYRESSPYRTLDPEHNMLQVGEALKRALEARGIGAIQDTTLHDYPDYADSYIRSRETVREYLETYPTIRLVLDLHRDAASLDSGTQLCTHARVNGRDAAQVMLVVGTDAGGRTHPGWQENMALAMKLHAQLEKAYPGLCRPIDCRTERFNQDLSAGALLVEVGAAGDTLEEALITVEALAEVIGTLSLGTATADSTS